MYCSSPNISNYTCCSFFAYRPAAAGSQDLIEFYTSSSITLVSLDVF